MNKEKSENTENTENTELLTDVISVYEFISGINAQELTDIVLLCKRYNIAFFDFFVNCNISVKDLTYLKLYLKQYAILLLNEEVKTVTSYTDDDLPDPEDLVEQDKAKCTGYIYDQIFGFFKNIPSFQNILTDLVLRTA